MQGNLTGTHVKQVPNDTSYECQVGMKLDSAALPVIEVCVSAPIAKHEYSTSSLTSLLKGRMNATSFSIWGWKAK
jgi:hypothetical protein